MISIIVLLEFRFGQARVGLLKWHVEFADGVESKLPPAGRQLEQSHLGVISIIVLLEFRFGQARMGLLKWHVEFADGERFIRQIIFEAVSFARRESPNFRARNVFDGDAFEARKVL